MAIKQYIGIFIALVAQQLCYGQQETASSKFAGAADFPAPNFAPHVVIRVNDKSIELNAEESEKFMKESMKDSRGIKTITVLNSHDASEKYGIRGKNGVVIAQYQDVYKLPWDLQMKLIELR